ncbi:ABC transporter permease [Nakamurella lactea]|uniref:ABC transporter permease n=1 Tax=Nakamurella lactea TaxID=459515 RepID=UPI0003F66181|nr:ABC transporter permease [Nakamurella lactea]
MSPVHHDQSADAAVQVMRSLPPPKPVTDSGLPPGFNASRTLPVRVELGRQFGRRRTQLVLGFMVALPIILAIAFAFDTGDDGGTSFVDMAQHSATNFALTTQFFSATFLLVVVVSLFFGDTVASEASWSSLRYLLAMPVPRIRLLRQKFVVAGLMSLLALVVLTAAAWILGAVLYGTGSVSTPTGESFTGWGAIGRLGIIVLYLAVSLIWVAGLAFLLSVSTDAPLGAVGGAVLLAILSQILDQIDALGGIRDWLPTHYSFAWTGAMVDPIRWDDMVRGGFSSLCYAVLFTGLAFWRFSRKDITS